MCIYLYVCMHVYACVCALYLYHPAPSSQWESAHGGRKGGGIVVEENPNVSLSNLHIMEQVSIYSIAILSIYYIVSATLHNCVCTLDLMGCFFLWKSAVGGRRMKQPLTNPRKKLTGVYDTILYMRIAHQLKVFALACYYFIIYYCL